MDVGLALARESLRYRVDFRVKSQADAKRLPGLYARARRDAKNGRFGYLELFQRF